MLETALKLLAMGYWVVAIRHGEKRPVGQAWGAERWTEDRLRAAFAQHPKAGIGICFGPGRGPGGSWLIDIEGDGPGAVDSFAALHLGEEIETPSWSSVRGGHTLFTADGDRLLKLLAAAGSNEEKGMPGVYHLPMLPDLEFRVGGINDKGAAKQLQSVVPPTPGTNGEPRAWVVQPRTRVAPLTEDVYLALGAIHDDPGNQKPADRVIARLKEKGKDPHSTGNRQWGAWCPAHAGTHEDGLSVTEKDGKVLFHCFAGCAPRAILKALDLSWRDIFDTDEPREPSENGQHAPSRNGPPRRLARLTISLEDVVPAAVDWLWEDRIAIGFITIFAGRTGMGKSFILCDVAARLSRGEPPPFSTLSRAPMRTVIVSEDPVNVMLGPRLIELGAVKSMIRFMTWEAMAIFSLDDQAMLDQLYEECGKPTLLVIDPPTNFIGDVDEHKNSAVRGMLMGLVKWLDEHKVACVLITHINKAIGKGLDAVERIVGSIAWGACARITIAFAKNPDMPGQLVCGVTKNNLGEIAAPLDYQILKTERLARIHWIGKSEVTIDDAINQIKKKSRGMCAVEWLTDRFKEKREWESDDIRRLAAEYGISKNALWSEEVNALPISKRPRTNAQGDRYWLWIAQEGWPPGNVQPETREPPPDYRF